MPFGVAFALSIGAGYLAAYELYCDLKLLPLWAAILVGVAIVCFGVYMEFKHGYMEL
jgi:hypothetical protein